MSIDKNIRFNYFEVMLTVDDVLFATNENVLQKINSLKGKKGHEKDDILALEEGIIIQQEVFENYQANKWDMSDMLDYYIKRPKTKTCFLVDDTKFEIEPGSLSYIKKSGIYSFQITKFRDTNIPAKKKEGQAKVDIYLTDEEYIGEFVSILYDKDNYTIMLQSNNYGASVKQVEKYLTALRRNYLIKIKDTECIKELICELRVIVDQAELKSLKKAKYFKDVRLRGADYMIDALLDEKDFMGKIRRHFGNQYGIEIDINISVNTIKRTDSLNQESIIGLIDNYNKKIENCKSVEEIIDKFEIKKKEDDNTNVEIVDLINPRMKSSIKFKMEERKSIDQKSLRDEMLVEYDKKRKTIEILLSPTK